jgi:hypothetical protein
MGWNPPDMRNVIDLRAVSSALFLPLLLWTGSVIVISLMGYPGVIYMTPVAWLLALPVGLRVFRESQSPGKGPVLDAAVGGAVLGLWLGLMVPAVMFASAFLPGKMISGPPSPIFAAGLSILFGVPVTAGLAALITIWMARK